MIALIRWRKRILFASTLISFAGVVAWVWLDPSDPKLNTEGPWE